MKLIIDIPYEAYYTFKCDLGKGNLNALAEIVANGTPYEERPQGEWIYHTEGYFAFYTCNRCNGIVGENDKFCGHCGAEKMKGGVK